MSSIFRKIFNGRHCLSEEGGLVKFAHNNLFTKRYVSPFFYCFNSKMQMLKLKKHMHITCLTINMVKLCDVFKFNEP